MSIPDIPHIVDGIEVEFSRGRELGTEAVPCSGTSACVGGMSTVMYLQCCSHLPRPSLCRDWRSTGLKIANGCSKEQPDLDSNDPYDLAKVAAVVRGLCERWKHPTPDWIEAQYQRATHVETSCPYSSTPSRTASGLRTVTGSVRSLPRPAPSTVSTTAADMLEYKIGRDACDNRAEMRAASRTELIA